ncbi:MAG: hypothetical protein QOF28_2476, partial [Actinomycetota bacterium]|nr:hypothetical protein [Actinomycetota bacterium]
RGARVVANPTAWVTSLPPPEGKNSQAEFLWRVRALENRVVAVAATKVGVEADTVIYAGRSQIVAADGRVVAVASDTEPELLVADVEVPTDAGDRPTSARPPSAVIRRPPLRAGYLQVAVLTHDDLLDGLAEHGVDVAVGPGGVLRAGHRSGDRSGDIALSSFTDDELLDPGAARSAALQGAEFVVWHARRVSTPFVEEVARTRALENRVFVLLWRPPDQGGPAVVDPSGTVIARSAGERFAVQASCLRAAAATKAMAPGTDAWDAVAEFYARSVGDS